MAKSVQSHLTKALENTPAESAQCREVLKDEVPNIAAAVDQMKCDNTMEQLFETESAPIQQGSGPHSAPGPSDGQAPAVTTIAAPIPANQKRGYSKEELASGTLTPEDLEAAGYVRVLSRPGDKGIVGLNCGLIMSGPFAGHDLSKIRIRKRLPTADMNEEDEDGFCIYCRKCGHNYKNRGESCKCGKKVVENKYVDTNYVAQGTLQPPQREH